MKKFSIILLLAAFLLQGYASYRQIELVDVEFGKVKMKALTKAEVHVTLKIENPTGRTFFITSMDGVVKGAGSEFAKFTLAHEVAVAPGKPASVPAIISAEVTDPLALLSSGLNAGALKNGNFTVDAAVQVRKGMAKKWFRVKDIPLKELLENLNL